MTGETDTEIPDTGAVFTFGKSKIANNVPSRLWLKNDIPVHISCGQSHSAFGTEQGRLFVSGSNNSGQLGLQTKGPVTKPTCVKVLKGERVQFVACGTDHTLISTSQGEIFAAGGNSDGQLGLGHCNASISFQRLRPFCDYAPIKLLSAGGHTSAALTEDGRLFMWGDNSVGQLGLGNDSHALLPKELKLGQPIQWVSCGYRHSALVTDNGDVFTFGESADGRLGLSVHQLANHSCPQRVESLHRVLQVACGGKHTLALTEDELYCFGCGEFGQLGLGTLMFEADAPVAVGHFRKGRVTHVTCGENHSALITDSGLLYTFGDGRHGKLGHGDENFTNQFSPTVCQRLFDYTVMAVACGSSHMLVFARPRQQESEEVCLEDEDVTYSYLDRCYTSMLQGQALEHIPDPAPAHVSQLTFLPSSLPTSHRWSLSTRARRRQRESSSAQFGPEFCSLPPLTTGFTALALTGNILNPDTPKRFRTDAPVESLSTSITLPARTPQFTPITKSTDDCHNVGSSENSMSDKTHEQHTHKMARTSSIGKEVNVPRQSPPTEVLAGSVSHPSMTESPSPSNLKHKKPRSGDPKNLAMQDEHFTATVSQSKMRSKTYKKPIQSTNIKCKGQAVEVRSSPERMSDKEREGCSETCSTYTDSRHKVSKADKYNKVQHADLRGQEVTTLAEMEQETKPSSLKIQKCSPVQEVKQVRTMPTKVQEVKSHQIKDDGIPVRATKSVKSPVKVQDVPSGRMEVNVVESTLQTDPAQKDIKPSLGKGQEVRSTLVNTQEMGNPTSVKIPAKMQNTAKKGNDKNTVDTEENTGQLTAKKKKKKRSDVERAPMKETAPKIPNPLLVSIPTRMSKAKKRKPVEAENSNVQIKNEMQVQVKSENDSKTLQNSNISFPPIENRKSGGTAKISQSASNLQSEHKNSQSPTDKVLTEQKYEFPSIKSLQPERSHSLSSFQSNNKSAISKSSITKEMESLSGNLLSQSPQHRQLPLNEIKLDGKSVEPEEPDWKPQAEQGIMGSVVSSLPAMAIASAAPLLIKAAEVLSETSPGQNNKMSLCASVSQEIAGNNILPEQEVEQDSTVQDISAIEEIDDSSTKKQSAHNGQSKLVSDENRKTEEEEDVMDSEKEERSEEERLAEKEDENEEAGQKEENSEVEDEEERGIDNDEDSVCAQKGEEDSEEEAKEEESEGTEQKEVNSAVEDEEEREGDNDEDRDSAQKGEEDGEEEEGEEEESEGVEKIEDNSAVEDEEERESDDDDDSDSAQKGEEDREEEEGEEEESEAAGEEEGDSLSELSSKSEGEKSEEGSGDETERKEEESEDGKMEEEENKDEESGGEDEEEEQESWDEGSEGEVEDEKTDAEEEQEEESSNEEKTVVGEQSDSEDENKNVRSDEEGGESEENDRSEEEEEDNETEEGEQDEKGDEESEEEDEVGYEDEEENQDKKDGVTNSEEEEEEESVKEKEEQKMVEAEDKENISGTRKVDRGDEDDEVDKLNEMMEENNEEESGSEEEEEEEKTDKKEQNIKPDRSGRKQTETNEEAEEETEQKENKIKPEINRRKQKESSEEEEEHEEESEEEEEEEAEPKEMNIKTEKNRRKRIETSEEEEEQEEESEEEEEVEQKEINIKTEKNRRKQIETSEEEEEQEEESEEEEEEEAERKEINIKTEKNRRKQRETSEKEEEHEEEGEEETEGEEEGEDEGEEEEEEGEEEEEKTNKVPKQRAKPNVLPARRQKNPQRDRQKTRQRHEQNGKGKKQTDDAQDPQFWNSVLPQYLNLK